MTAKVFDAIHHFSCRRRGAVFQAACAVAVAVGDHHRKHGSRFRLSDALEARENRDSQCHRPADVLSARGLATFWIFQRMIKTAVMEVLPDHTYWRWRPLAAPADLWSLKQWVLAALGILGGAVTHLVWDAFTHEGARGIRMIPALDDPVMDIAGHRLMGHRLLQDGSSLIGLAVVLAVVIYGLRRDSGPEEASARTLRPRERHVWILIYAVTAPLLAGLFLVMRRASFGHSLAFIVGNFAIATLRGFAAALILVRPGVELAIAREPFLVRAQRINLNPEARSS